MIGGGIHWSLLTPRRVKKRPFFIEYYVINPALGSDKVIPGQLPENRAKGIKPSYAMLKAGAWGTLSGEKASQIHNMYPINQFKADFTKMEVSIGPHTANETHLKGSVKLTKEEATAHPEYMSDAGEMSWDLKAEKVLPYSVGFGTSPFFVNINAFLMYWHAAGMYTRYSGTILFNGQQYNVEPDTCAGYQDKNWGGDYTSPWVWLNCNNFTNRATGKKMVNTGLDCGGAQPVVFGMSLPRRMLIAFYLEGKLHEFNFSKVWTGPQQVFDNPITKESVGWNLTAWNKTGKIENPFQMSTRDHAQRQL